MGNIAEYSERTISRIIRITAALGVIGHASPILIKAGLKPAAGFLIGSIFALLNFHGLRRMVDGLSGRAHARVQRLAHVLGVPLRILVRDRLCYSEPFGNQLDADPGGVVYASGGDSARNPVRTNLCTNMSCCSPVYLTIIWPA